MESLAVGFQVCRERGTRFLGIRVISDDTLTSDLPVEVAFADGADRHDSRSLRGNRRTLVAALERHGYVEKAGESPTQTAARRLATFLDGVVVQLYNALH